MHAAPLSGECALWVYQNPYTETPIMVYSTGKANCLPESECMAFVGRPSKSKIETGFSSFMNYSAW
jgi:hypothetical protein